MSCHEEGGGAEKHAGGAEPPMKLKEGVLLDGALKLKTGVDTEEGSFAADPK